MTNVRRILVVNSSAKAREEMRGELERDGYQILEGEDGALAINKAIVERPDMIITAVSMPLIDGFKLCQLLRSNPATQHIPFLFITDKETNPKKLGQFIKPADDFILKPFKPEELLGRVHDLFYRLDKVQAVAEEADRTVAGTLSEMPLVDLLQIFKMNSRSGILTLKTEGRTGSIFIRDGIVINARTGKASGLKAIFRLISWENGTFEFKPSLAATEVKIHQGTENIIMEGLRQFDELKRLRQKKPLDKVILRVKDGPVGSGKDLSPVCKEVLKLLEFFERLDDLLENSFFPDLEVYTAVLSLLDHNFIEEGGPRTSEAATARGPLLSMEEALNIGYYLGIGRGEPNQQWLGKVLVFSQRPDYLETFLEKAQAVQEFQRNDQEIPDDERLKCDASIKASISIMDKTTLLLLHVSAGKGCEPLWEVFHHRAFGALVLGDGSEKGERVFDDLAGYLAEREIPYVAVAMDPTTAGGSPEGSGAISWLRADPERPDFPRRVLRGLFEAILGK